MTQQLTPETLIELSACTQLLVKPVSRLALSLHWTIDPATGRPVGRWVADISPDIAKDIA